MQAPGIDFVCPGFASGACLRNIYCGGRVDIECPGLAWMRAPASFVSEAMSSATLNGSPVFRSVRLVTNGADAELDVLGVCIQAFDQLTPAQARRVAEFLVHRTTFAGLP